MVSVSMVNSVVPLSKSFETVMPEGASELLCEVPPLLFELTATRMPTAEQTTIKTPATISMMSSQIGNFFLVLGGTGGCC